MSAGRRVLVTTDSFPPICGGSGWSTWELVRGLTSLGHDVRVLKVAAGTTSGLTQDHYQSVPVTTFSIRAPGIPFVRNLIKNERLWARLTRYLTDDLRRHPVDIVHAQHVMTTVPSIRAGHARGTPVVATVRDYWPVCYWSDLIYDPRQSRLCPRCSASMMTRCLQPRAGAASMAAWPMIPYMRANLATKRTTLARADAIIAVSSAIARDLAERAREIPAARLHTIPNPVDMTALDDAYVGSPVMLAEPYVLYAGKIAPNKGTQFLVRALVDAGIRWPLVVVGDGPDRALLETAARSAGIDLRIIGWRPREEVWAWMRHASMLAFPSYGPESLSRVLIESAALGTPIAAMNTGGTTDILQHDRTALVADDVVAFSAALAQLAADPALRGRLGAAARDDVRTRFAAPLVVGRVAALYESLLSPGAR
ncbi:MAG: glycosyltransferase family 4 protein [Acidobacteriota bacterium]